MKYRRIISVLNLGVLAAMASSPALAQETTTYTYDALGRLIKVDRDKSSGAQTSAEYEYDSAGNRTKLTATGNDDGNNGGNGGSGSDGANRGFVVVPLSGYTLIFYEN